MTNKEAIEILRSIRVYDIYPKSASEETKQALDIVIKALEERPQGEWIEKQVTPASCTYACSECGTEEVILSNFCRECGARMKGGAYDNGTKE